MIDLVVVGQPFLTLKKSIPEEVNLIIEDFNGYNYSLNRGAEKGNNPIIGFCNNDLEIVGNAIGILIRELKKYDSVSPWCPLTHRNWWGNTIPKNPVQGYKVGQVLAGWCFFTKRETWEKIGGFDERISFWCSDNSYAEQLKEHKLTHALIPEAHVIHWESQTLNTKSTKEQKELTRDQIKLFNRLYNKNLFGLGC